MKTEEESCERVCVKYRGENLYIVPSDTRVDLSMSNHDQFQTLAGLGLVQRLINTLLDENVMSLEDISGLCHEESYIPSDLPGILSRELVR